MKKLFCTLALFALVTAAYSQTNNIYEDAKALRTFYNTTTQNLNKADSAKWLPILKKYVPKASQLNYRTIAAYFRDDPFDLKAGALININGSNASGVADDSGEIPAAANNSPTSFNGFSANVFADALAQVIIKRATEELTATFFVEFRKKLDANPELQIIFPKTYQFIDQIQPYLYAGYLNTLKQGFLQDVNALPQHLGSFLRSDRIRAFMSTSPGSEKSWLAVPVLCFLGDLNKGSSIADCIKDLYPDAELQPIAPNYYSVLKLTAVLSESVRDASGTTDWISATDFDKNIIRDPVTTQLFFGLLYESVSTIDLSRGGNKISFKDYIDNNPAQIVAVTTVIKNICAGYPDVTAAYKDIRTMAALNDNVSLASLLGLINKTTTDVKATLADINNLTGKPALNVNINSYFAIVPQVTEVIKNINEKKYSSAIMNSVILAGQFVEKGRKDLTPFKTLDYVNPALVNGKNLGLTLDTAIVRLSDYAKRYQNKDIAKLVASLKTAQGTLITDPAGSLAKTVAVFNTAVNYTDSFDANVMYSDFLKYASFMAAISEAKTTEEVSDALDAAILPPGSSSIKYYTAFSFSINSYIGGSFYKEYYRATVSTPATRLNTLGFALPVGLNISMSTRWKEVGAVSVFVSVVDIGAVASYRLNNPPNVTSSSLPNFTWQNILAPGVFVVAGRLLNTPLSLGVGVQKGPQLRSISYTNGTTSADISAQQNYRLGAFLSVDIPLFNLYSKALKRPVAE